METRFHADHSCYATDEERPPIGRMMLHMMDWVFLVGLFRSPAFKVTSERN
ncbi:hypothetical protein KY285_028242 [Solanum tuberosum]|nr:hypothetical protein KY284_028196 [Solanum tuberosum]KAH0667036.1 hypothetical protein KY285_028242 [Solanum tuberosum]